MCRELRESDVMNACRKTMNDPQKAGGTEASPSSRPPLQVFSIDSREPRGALAADPPLAPTDELMEELQQASEQLEAATPQEILRWAVERFAPRFTMATAFGPEGMTIIHMLAEIAPGDPDLQPRYRLSVPGNARSA